MAKEKFLPKVSRVMFHDCVPAIMHIVCWFVWVLIMMGIGVYVVMGIVPDIGTSLLKAAAIPEDAMLVTWAYAYIMPYFVACVLIVVAFVFAARATWSWLDGHVGKFAERVRVWYDGRQ